MKHPIHPDDVLCNATLYIGCSRARVEEALTRTNLRAWTCVEATGAWTREGQPVSARKREVSTIVGILGIRHALAFTYAETLRGILREQAILLQRQDPRGAFTTTMVVGHRSRA